jgi:hypothetical protein
MSQFTSSFNHSVHSLQLHHVGHLVDHQLLQVVQLGVPLVQGRAVYMAIPSLLTYSYYQDSAWILFTVLSISSKVTLSRMSMAMLWKGGKDGRPCS